jgi:hypothetical protein
MGALVALLSAPAAVGAPHEAASPEPASASAEPPPPSNAAALRPRSPAPPALPPDDVASVPAAPAPTSAAAPPPAALPGGDPLSEATGRRIAAAVERLADLLAQQREQPSGAGSRHTRTAPGRGRGGVNVTGGH